MFRPGEAADSEPVAGDPAPAGGTEGTPPGTGAVPGQESERAAEPGPGPEGPPGAGVGLGPATWTGPDVTRRVAPLRAPSQAPLRALLLDCYGTLVHEDDSVVAEICAEAAAAIGGAGPEVLGRAWADSWRVAPATVHGSAFETQYELCRRTLAEAAAQVGARPLPDALLNRLIDRQRDYWRAPVAHSGLAGLLKASEEAGLRVCVASNIDRDDLTAALRHVGLSALTHVTSEEVRAYKPRPELFSAALQSVGVDAAEALYVGDSWRGDVLGAAGLGLASVWVNRRGLPLPAPEPNDGSAAPLLRGVITELDELRAFLTS